MNEGGIIGKQNITTAISASGMWSGNQVFLRNTVSGEWPSFNAPDTQLKVTKSLNYLFQYCFKAY